MIDEQSRKAAKTSNTFAPNCLSIDLEVGIKNSRINQFAAVRGDNRQSFCFNKGKLNEALDKLDDFAHGVAFLLGHNIVAFDLPHLAAASPDLRILNQPAVDTLQLNPLAFPRNPYHHLVKHYQNGQLKRERINNPELDAQLTLDVFRDQLEALRIANTEHPELVLAWHWLTTAGANNAGLNAFFSTLRRKPRPGKETALQTIYGLLHDNACLTHAREAIAEVANQGWPLAYALAWLSVSGGNSVMPPWVRHQFPRAGALIKSLRDTACGDSACDWCRKHHDPCRELKRWFNLDNFRPEPAEDDGTPTQQAIVKAAMQGEHVLGILPTGTGKSLCYQIPALSRYYKTGALTVVISPLVALMADQVTGLEARGITSCGAINGMLSMPERAAVLDRVRLGDIGILIIAPEQLRNKSVRRVLEQREIGSWVLDEAHCVSKWGHDFRPDYRYVAKFIRQQAGSNAISPVLCLTATAKPEVVKDIVEHFQQKVGIELRVFNGGANRTNLNFAVVSTSLPEKFGHVHQMLIDALPPDTPGGAIVYCATRRHTEEMAEYLLAKDIPAAYFHSQLPPETKKKVQQRFINGEIKVIAATNAFGMGIDKPDVRLVIHADIPGSLENYLQEAGRAGRDRASATCVLLYTQEDVEKQFGMSARSRLKQGEIQGILRALKNLDRKKRFDGAIVATSGEILAEDEDAAFIRDSATDDTRVRTAIAWLEEASLVVREENEVQIFPSSLRVASLDEAEAKLQKRNMNDDYRQQLLAIIGMLMDADKDEGISTDALMGISGMTSEKLQAALHDLEHMGIASNDTALTAFVHSGVEHSSRKRFEEATAMEKQLIDMLRETAHDLQKGESTQFYLRRATQQLKDGGCTNVLPEKLSRIIKGLAEDGRDEDRGLGSLRSKRLDEETLLITLQREWSALDKTAQLRRAAAEKLLNHILTRLPQGSRGTDLLAETTLGKLLAAIEEDLVLKAETKAPVKLLDRALMWLHEMEIIRLNKGLAVFRPAMTIHLGQERRNFMKSDFLPLQIHYQEQVLQIHIMAEYVQRGLQAMAHALQLAMDYFHLEQESFLNKWLPGRKDELTLQTTPESWRSIVENLRSPIQQRIVADDREQTNVLVLAGPGSGKTRVLVHRIAYLIRVKRENPRSIIALAYNRHAAVEIRERLHGLIHDDANGITVMTCHALAMRLVGASFAKQFADNQDFKQILKNAVALLKGSGLPPEEADEQRSRLLAGFRWMLVDEYQDIDLEQYELISALAGRTLEEEDGKLTLFAVGDDDQNIYGFDGASVEFIRRFASDYQAKPTYLVENYRSTKHIIDASNLIISPASQRMKTEHPITINHVRSNARPGGDWEARDHVARGRVQILPAGNSVMTQAVATMAELMRLASLSADWRWDRCAVIAREWSFLEPVRAWCEIHNIPVQMADDDTSQFWRLRETQALVSWVRERGKKLTASADISLWLDAQATGPWWSLLWEALDAYVLETSGMELPTEHFLEWLAEWGREFRRKQQGLLLLTAHRAKGLEFDHVAVLDGAWEKASKDEDRDASRRLYYVAMTRARETLLLARFDKDNALLKDIPECPSVIYRPASLLASPSKELTRKYQRLSLREIDIGYAGRYRASDVLHQKITELQVADSLQLLKKPSHWELANSKGETVGKLSKGYSPPLSKRLVSGKVTAIVTRLREDSEPEYQDRIRCDRWEVVVPELVFE